MQPHGALKAEFMESTIFETCMISTFILLSFECKNPEISLGCINSDISKYGQLKEICLYFHLQFKNSKRDDIQSWTYTVIDCFIQAFIDFGKNLGMLCVNL